jgi:hypothetical protein
MTRQQIVDTLRALPDEIDKLVEGLSEDTLRWRPTPEDWSIKEVCAHLRDSTEIDGERIRRMATEDDPVLPAYDQEALAREKDYRNESTPLILTGLRAFLGGLAYLLEGLSEEDWQRSGRHEERGPISLAQYAELSAQHARAHLAQVTSLREQAPPGR